MGSSVREKRHRLPPNSYRGLLVVAFTINVADHVRSFNDRVCVAVASCALAEAFVNHGGHVGVYVFMPEHVHLMVSGKDERSDLLGMIKDFKQKTAVRLHKAGQPFEWQKDFYDHIVRSNEDYGAQVRYLLRNPVRRGLCVRWQDWPQKGVLGQTWEQLTLAIATL